MAKIRIQFPEEKTTVLLGTMPVKITDEDAVEALKDTEKHLRDLVDREILINRPTLRSARSAQTTHGPAVVMEIAGDVSLRMLREIERGVEKSIEARAIETLVVT